MVYDYLIVRQQNKKMKNIIAIIWDFDKILINGYMEEPIFAEYGVNLKIFWLK